MAQEKIRHSLADDIETVSRIDAVPTILEVVCRTTGMGFAAVARVTDQQWVACSVLDEIAFGLKAGGELKLETTICHEIRQSRQPVIIEHVAEDDDWRCHSTPAMYGFQSYISMPIILNDGTFFGTLCAIDPRPAKLKSGGTVGMFRLFAELIAKNLDTHRKLGSAEAAVVEGQRLLQETEISLQSAERSNEALQRFAYIASHDLREPLRQVSIFTELLAKKHGSDDESREFFDFVQAGAARMERLVDGLMGYAQISGMGTTLLQTADLEACLNEALLGLRLAVQDAGAVVSHDALPALPGNPSQLAELLQNLISNALKYRSKEAPRIHVAAALQENEWIVSVRDNGRGVPPEHSTAIFEIFARLHGPEIDGAGLGLAFCAKVIELHRGRIWVEPNPASPTGSMFCFALPDSPLSAALTQRDRF